MYRLQIIVTCILTLLLLLSMSCEKKKGSERSDERPAPDRQETKPDAASRLHRRRPSVRNQLQVQKTAQGHEVEIISRPKSLALPRKKVPFTTEPFTLTVRPEMDVVVERNILGTGLAMDLDGDGRTTGRLKASCRPDGSVVLADNTLWPLGFPIARYRDDKNAPRSVRLGPKGAHALLYTPCQKNRPITVGLSPASQPIVIVEVDSPALQILVFQQAGSPKAQSTIRIVSPSLNGKPLSGSLIYHAKLYDRLFGKPEWIHVTWLMVPLSRTEPENKIRFTITGHGPDARAAVMAQLNFSRDGSSRTRIILDHKSI